MLLRTVRLNVERGSKRACTSFVCLEKIEGGGCLPPQNLSFIRASAAACCSLHLEA